MSNTFDKLSILDSFIEEVDSYLPEIEANLDRMAQDVQEGRSTSDVAILEETYRSTHTIGGSASMMDFSGLAHIAHGMEDILGDILDEIVTLDAPTVALLQRSLGRLRLLLEGIRGEADDNALIAEDDADFERYRAQQEQGQEVNAEPVAQHESSLQPTLPMSPIIERSHLFEMEQASSQAQPSFDEVLASFRTPALDAEGAVEWPEEFPEQDIAATQTPAYREQEQEFVASPVAFSTGTISDSTGVPPKSALEELAAATTPAQLHDDAKHSSDITTTNAHSQHVSSQSMQVPAESNQVQVVPAVPVAQLPPAYDDLKHDAQSLESQALSMQGLVSQLRSAMAVVEAQRSEFKGFLDGSKDALDRMEDWAGKTMGLNLRNSPEQVRKYLPLSVMWAANSKLKKVLEFLNQVTGGAELTEEQMRLLVDQLHVSISAFGEAFQSLPDRAPASRVLKQEEGWSPWTVQADNEADRRVQERITFERYGNLEEIRGEIEANLRKEFEHEYLTVSLASRAELEQRIRNEVRQELVDNQLLHGQASGQDVSGLRQELERQLRNEIEIQVRQEFLDHIASSNGDTFLDDERLAESDTESSVSRLNLSNELMGKAENPLHSVIAPTSATDQLKAPTVSATSTMSSDFTDEATEIFRLEAEEHLQTISTNVAALEKDPTNRDYIQSIRRATHTLKGAAGMMGFRTIAELSHISEDLLDSIMEENAPISSEVLSIILDTTETLDSLISGKSAEQEEEVRVQSLRVRYTQLLGERSGSVPTSLLDDDLDLVEEEESTREHITDTSLVANAPSSSSNHAVSVHMRQASFNDLSVRVNLQKLDELVNLFGEVLVNRSVLEERIQRLVRLVADVGISSNRLRDVGQRLESRFEAATLPSGRSVVVMPGEGDTNAPPSANRTSVEPAHLADFDMLEMDRYTEFHQLARGLSEGISDMSTLSTEMDTLIRECEGVFARENRLSTTFQDRLMKTRLVPLSTMAPRLERAARAVAFRQHKEVEFELEGGETEVDRTVYEEISGPLLHLMRNAVNHAIETPEVRVQHGKPTRGRVIFTASYESNQIVITVRDDGRGIDPEQIRNVAVARGLIAPDQALSESETIELIFKPGFSTSEVVSEESGRGVGLDVVRDGVSRLRGSIEVETMINQGTAFTMKFPTSMAIQSAMMVIVGGQQFAVPTSMIESIGRLDTFKRTTNAGQPAILVRDELYPLSMLSQYLNLPIGQITDKSHILLVNAGGKHVALVIDEVRGKLDIVAKNLGPHLRNLRGIAGATVLGNGQVVLILELSELLSTRNRFVGPIAKIDSPRRESRPTPPAPVSSSVGSQTAPPVARVQPTPQQTQVIQSPQISQQPAPGDAARQRAEIQPGVTSGAPTNRAVGAARQQTNAELAVRGKYVLVVDDSPSVRRVVSNMLKQNGWEVQLARDGVEALELISRETPSAVLLDIEMPRMDGYELIATVRAQEQFRTLPMVVLTSRAAAKHQQRAMLLGASGYVIKPYQDEELLNTLNSLVIGAMAL